MVMTILNFFFMGLCLYALMDSFNKSQYGWTATFALLLGILVGNAILFS